MKNMKWVYGLVLVTVFALGWYSGYQSGLKHSLPEKTIPSSAQNPLSLQSDSISLAHSSTSTGTSSTDSTKEEIIGRCESEPIMMIDLAKVYSPVIDESTNSKVIEDGVEQRLATAIYETETKNEVNQWYEKQKDNLNQWGKQLGAYWFSRAMSMAGSAVPDRSHD